MLIAVRRAIVLMSLLVVTVGVATPVGIVAQEESPRKITRRVKPVYPAIGRSIHLSGTVKLALVVAPDGKVKSVRVTGGHPLLAVAASDAAKMCLYEPGPKESNELLSFQFDYAAADEK